MAGYGSSRSNTGFPTLGACDMFGDRGKHFRTATIAVQSGRRAATVNHIVIHENGFGRTAAPSSRHCSRVFGFEIQNCRKVSSELRILSLHLNKHHCARQREEKTFQHKKPLNNYSTIACITSFSKSR